ncbi:hypothetical protein [Stackebrandtia nassauensis]|uniref:Uncharacterized protein n=1 Tax=Stackebrandtia nassauensis (strain DSM 44728 / CIP 108903 / NRRL B-16338 / NBRC 102104 / LLR-40K-21) TaxID=446470 RepID=D3Q373_STANL|nr:hypothetical protein [Stackebrandtia nassauensis]ADD40043.1 hypothetical protein Snas_0325 [Stackebrandtia nassauensis DSM 44728]
MGKHDKKPDPSGNGHKPKDKVDPKKFVKPEDVKHKHDRKDDK